MPCLHICCASLLSSSRERQGLQAFLGSAPDAAKQPKQQPVDRDGGCVLVVVNSMREAGIIPSGQVWAS